MTEVLVRVRLALTLLLLGACSRTDLDLQAEPDAGPGACALVANGCVHTGDPGTQCLALGYTAVDPQGPCVDGDVVYACNLVRAGLVCPPSEVCLVIARDDGGPEEALVPSLCGNLPSQVSCDTDAYRALAAARAGNHGLLPLCRADAGAPPVPADAGAPDAGHPQVDAGPPDAGPSRCELVDGGCVHSGDTSTYCIPQAATFIDAQRLCYEPGNGVYACALSSQFVGCQLDVYFETACDADGGLSEIIQISSCNVIQPSVNFCHVPLPDNFEDVLFSPGDHTCPPPDAGPP